LSYERRYGINLDFLKWIIVAKSSSQGKAGIGGFLHIRL